MAKKWFRNVRTGLVEAWDEGSALAREAETAKYRPGRDPHTRAALFEDVTPDGGGGGGALPAIGATVSLSGDAFAASGGVVPFDTVVYDSDGFFDLANTRLVIPAGQAGIYLYGALIVMKQQIGQAEASAWIDVNGNPANIQGIPPQQAADNSNVPVAFMNIEAFAVGDSLLVRAGTDLTNYSIKADVSGRVHTRFYVARLGDAPA